MRMTVIIEGLQFDLDMDDKNIQLLIDNMTIIESINVRTSCIGEGTFYSRSNLD